MLEARACGERAPHDLFGTSKMAKAGMARVEERKNQSWISRQHRTIRPEWMVVSVSVA